MLIGKEHWSALVMISQWEFKRVTFLTSTFSLFMNVGQLFQYRLNYGLNLPRNGVYADYSNVAYPFIVIENVAFSVYTLVYFIIDCVVFLTVNTWLEASIVVKLRDEIAEKRKRAEEEIRVSASHNNAHSEIVNKMLKAKKKKIEQDAKKETRAVVMVILNSILNFVLRVPEIFVFFASAYGKSYLLTGSDSIQVQSVFTVFYTILNLPNMIISVSYFTYILTFTTNVAIYYLFNPKF
jgi:hypothetical protein